MKKILSLFIAFIFIALSVVVAFADGEPKLVFEASYNADTNQVSVVVFVENPGAVSAADLRMGYDQNVYQFVESQDNNTISDMMVMSGKSVISDGLVCASILFTHTCEESYLTDNRLQISTFIFTPITEDYDINDFCLWAYSFELDDKDIAKSVSHVGNSKLKDGKTAPVTVADLDDYSQSSSSDKFSGKWYIYVIAVVLGVAVVAGVAVIAVKNGEKEENKVKKNDSASAKNG